MLGEGLVPPIELNPLEFVLGRLPEPVFEGLLKEVNGLLGPLLGKRLPPLPNELELAPFPVLVGGCLKPDGLEEPFG